MEEGKGETETEVVSHVVVGSTKRKTTYYYYYYIHTYLGHTWITLRQFFS